MKPCNMQEIEFHFQSSISLLIGVKFEAAHRMLFHCLPHQRAS